MAVIVNKPDSGTNTTVKETVKEKGVDNSTKGLIGIIFLLCLFVGLPLAITIWTVGTPLKGYNA